MKKLFLILLLAPSLCLAETTMEHCDELVERYVSRFLQYHKGTFHAFWYCSKCGKGNQGGFRYCTKPGCKGKRPKGSVITE